MSPSTLYALKYRFLYQQEETPPRYQVNLNYLAFWIHYDKTSQDMLLIAPTKKDGSPAIREPISLDEKTSLSGRINQQLERAIHHEESPIQGWYLSRCGLAHSEWESFMGGMTCGLETGLSKKRKYRDHFRSRTDNSVPPHWAIRGYFIGAGTNYAQPTVTVLCDDKKLSKWLVDLTIRQLLSHILPQWRVTRLPEVSVLEYGSHSDSPESSDQENFDINPESWAVAEAEAERSLERITVNITDDHPFPTMANESLSSWTREQHRCGIRLDVIRDSNVVARGTIGGLIKVGNKLYGLTVAHTFSSSNAATDAQEAHPGNQDTHPAFPGSGGVNSNDQEIFNRMDRWQESGSIGTELDWALVDIPELQQLDPNPELWEDVNLVHTISGDFRPAMLATKQPHLLARIVLATPSSTHGLRGVFIGSEALLGIPGSSVIYCPWVLRMERPWLLRLGDSGSWAFDAHTGELLGVLVAGCPHLLEAYIIPAYEIFQSIRGKFQDSVGLVNSQPIGKENWVSLTKTYKQILENIKSIKNPSEIENIENDASEKLRAYEANLQEPAASSFKLRTVRPSWANRFPIPVDKTRLVSRRQRLRFMEPQFEEYRPFSIFGSSSDTAGSPVPERFPSQYVEMYQKALLQHPQQCYNFLSERLANANMLEKASLRRFWDHLVLGKITVSLNRNISEGVDTSRRILENEEGLMSQETILTYPDTLTPWDRRNLSETFSDMKNRIKSQIGNQKSEYRWSSLPETSRIELASGVDAILTTMIIWTNPNCRVLAVFPPSSVGPETWSLSDDSSTLCSLMRLPFKVGMKTEQAEEQMKSELIAQLKLKVDDFKSLEKLQLSPGYSHFYLKEKGRLVELAVYEGFLNPREHEKVGRSPEGWLIMGSPRWRLNYYTADPFRKIFC